MTISYMHSIKFSLLILFFHWKISQWNDKVTSKIDAVVKPTTRKMQYVQWKMFTCSTFFFRCNFRSSLWEWKRRNRGKNIKLLWTHTHSHHSLFSMMESTLWCLCANFKLLFLSSHFYNQIVWGIWIGFFSAL